MPSSPTGPLRSAWGSVAECRGTVLELRPHPGPTALSRHPGQVGSLLCLSLLVSRVRVILPATERV